jgi:hypothetical protein
MHQVDHHCLKYTLKERNVYSYGSEVGQIRYFIHIPFTQEGDFSGQRNWVHMYWTDIESSHYSY